MRGKAIPPSQTGGAVEVPWVCPRLVPWPEWAVYRVTETWCGFGARDYCW